MLSPTRRNVKKTQKESTSNPKDAAKDALKEKYRQYRDFQNACKIRSVVK